MVLILDVGINPNKQGIDKYKEDLENTYLVLKGIIPEARLYEDGMKSSDYNGKIVIVKDDFSFGRGGGMRKSTIRLIFDHLFNAKIESTSYILLEPSSKLDGIIEGTAEIKVSSMRVFKKYSDMLVKQLRDDCKKVYEVEK